MRRLFLIAITTVAVAAFLTIPANSQVRSAAKWGQFWGTFLHQVHRGPGQSMPALITLQIDGTVTGAPGSMFGAVPNATTRFGPIHGVWQRTGWKTLAGTSLFITYDVNGVLTGFRRSRCSLEFSDDFNSYQGTEFMEDLSCSSAVGCPDPFAPAATWVAVSNMPVTGFQVSGTRVELVTAGPLKP
jgi:hypothetical protein